MRPCPIPLSRFLAQAYLGATLRPAIFDHDKYGSVPSGTNAVSEGSRLTLTVIRRIRARQCEHPAKTPNPYGLAGKLCRSCVLGARRAEQEKWAEMQGEHRGLADYETLALMGSFRTENNTYRASQQWRAMKSASPTATTLRISHRGPRAARGTSLRREVPEVGTGEGRALIDFYDMITRGYAALGRAWCKGGYHASFRHSFNRRHYRHGSY